MLIDDLRGVFLFEGLSDEQLGDLIAAGDEVRGPAVVEESASTTIVEPGDRVEVNRYGHLVMSVAL